MLLKVFGAAFVVVACGSVGFQMAANHHREERALQQLIQILDYMESELQCHLTPLPILCKQVAREFNHLPGAIFEKLAQQVEAQILPDLSSCMEIALRQHKQLPPITKSCIELLGRSIGRFDLEGQIKGFETVKQECFRQLEQLASNRDSRLRSYQTLGLCAGAALAILFV